MNLASTWNHLRRQGRALVLFICLGGLPPTLAAQSWLDAIDDHLFLQTPGGMARVDLSVLLDLEGYYIDQRPPGLIFGNDESFANPRASFFLDAVLGKHLYAFVQARIDRGFDPRSERQDARFDEYFLRYTPLDNGSLNLQAGKFATVVGNWVARHDSWQNPFINAPLPYERIVTVGDSTLTASLKAFRARAALADKKELWLPLIWGPDYGSGASVFGSVKKMDYAIEIKNSALSSRPEAWDGRDQGWEHPTLGSRIGFRPNASWNLGVSASAGAYLLPAAVATLPSGTGRGDYQQYTIGQDLSYAHGPWQFWSEIFFGRFEVPRAGNAELVAYYLEAKYKINSRAFAAVRWNQELFADMNGPGVPDGSWDRQTWRIDAALGYRWNRHWQGKIQYSFNHQDGLLQQGEQLVAGQITLKF